MKRLAKIFSFFLTAALSVSCASYKQPSANLYRELEPEPVPVRLDYQRYPVDRLGPELSPRCGNLSLAAERLSRDAGYLSSAVCAGRGTGTRGAVEASAYIFKRMKEEGLTPSYQTFNCGGTVCRNVIAEIPGMLERPLVVMAYYDGIGIGPDGYYPGADSNASAVAALLELGSRLSGGGKYKVVIAALDAHSISMAGAAQLCERYSRPSPALVVNLDILGSTLSPVFKLCPDYLLCLGGERYSTALYAANNSGPGLHLSFDYYGSANFTRLFYRSVSDQRFFLERGVPCLMFTSGISFNTNRLSDTFETLDFEILSRRVDLIGIFLENFQYISALKIQR